MWESSLVGSVYTKCKPVLNGTKFGFGWMDKGGMLKLVKKEDFLVQKF